MICWKLFEYKKKAGRLPDIGERPAFKSSVVSSVAQLPREPVIARSGAKSRAPLGRFREGVSAVRPPYLTDFQTRFP